MAWKLRENSNLQSPQSQNWSPWMLAMVPSHNPNRRKGLEQRGPRQEGCMVSNIMNIDDLCGIYEWRATRSDRLPSVVYVGSTCTRRGVCDLMGSRIIKYCKYGNHKKNHINDALGRGYELEVRYKPAANEEDARAQENELLAMYNYAWNVRKNVGTREIL